MTIGVFGQQWWTAAAHAQGLDVVPLPLPVDPPADKHSADAAARLARGNAALQPLSERPVSFLLDDAASGLQFVDDSPAGAAQPSYRLLHERLGVPLVSHLVDPVMTCLQALPPMPRYQSLRSGSWVKLVFDRAHAYELQQFEIPSVFHLPMAAWDRAYDTRPLDPARFETLISFVGSQLGTYFYPERRHDARGQLPGLIAQAVRSSRPDMPFYDIYHALYQFNDAPAASDSLELRVSKIETYYAAKLFYLASSWIAQRDRFVLFLARALPQQFRLHGRNWDAAYGLRCEPPLATYDAFLEHFRRCLINVNLVSGNCETGVNMRTFEITAAGGFMLHQARPELERYFEIGRECDIFRDEEELLAKCRYYLSNPQRCIEIAAAGQRRTLREHLYSHRLRDILRLLERGGSPGPAAATASAPSRFIAQPFESAGRT